MVFDTTTDFARIVSAASASIVGELVDRNRVIDTLLDLRNAALVSELVAIVDGLLRTVPGQTTVRASWWTVALDELALAASMELSEAHA